MAQDRRRARRLHPGLAPAVDAALREGRRHLAGPLRRRHVGRGAPPGPRASTGRSGPQGRERRGRLLRASRCATRSTGETIPTELEGLLRERGIERVVVCGLATDYCVNATALDARRLGFETFVLLDAVRAGQPRAGRRRSGRSTQMQAAGVRPRGRPRMRSAERPRAGPPRRRHLRAVPRPLRAAARRSSAATASILLGRLRARATSSSTCSARRARRTSAAPRTGSSSRSATTSSRATSRAPACRRDLLDQFPIAEAAIEALGLVLWPMVEFEADDAIAAAAGRFAADPAVERILDLHARQGHGPARRGRRGSCSGTGAADLFYDDAGVRAKWGVAAGLDPGLAGARRRLVRRLSRACPAGARSRRRPCSPSTARSRASRQQASKWEVPEPARRRRSSRRRSATTGTRRMLYRSLARLRTADDGVVIPQAAAAELRVARRAARRAGRRSATRGAWPDCASRPHRWLGRVGAPTRPTSRSAEQRRVVAPPAPRRARPARARRPMSNHGPAVHRGHASPRPRSAISPAAATSQFDIPPCWMNASNRPFAT